MYTFTDTNPASGTTIFNWVEGLNGLGPVTLTSKLATSTVSSTVTSPDWLTTWTDSTIISPSNVAISVIECEPSDTSIYVVSLLLVL